MQITAHELVDIGIYENESEVIMDGIRHLLLHHPEYRMKVALERYKNSEISLGKASELAGLSIEEMKELLKDFGISLKAPESIKDIINDAETARRAMK
jgi:predicted HTH domain antitoxin